MNNSTIALSAGLRSIAENLDDNIEEVAGEKIAFTLIVFTEGRASYISTCDRQDSIREMRNLLDLWEQDMPDIKAHDFNA